MVDIATLDDLHRNGVVDNDVGKQRRNIGEAAKRTAEMAPNEGRCRVFVQARSCSWVASQR